MFYKVATPIGNIIVRSACNNPCATGICHCYRKYEPYKTMSMDQFSRYQKCRDGTTGHRNETKNNVRTT